MTNFMDVMSDEYMYYSERGEKLKILYTLQDFLENPSTNEILVNQWNDTFRKTIEEPINEFIEDEKEEQVNKGTMLFKNDKGGEFEGELVIELYNYVKPNYDLEIFYNNPELAKNFDT